MVYTLSKIITFEASHQLMNHDGKCARLHGHSWRAAIVCSGNQLIDSGAKQNMLIDYGDIKGAVKDIVDDYLDHHHLNETLKTDSPTSEFLARWLYKKIKPQLPILQEVKVWETCTSECSYSEN
jgi:6-pyruvoyltetrahydropterin/6-carboxytetrahydropterin synthase